MCTYRRYVTRFLPRAVYTTGKASTAAGLTASVVKEVGVLWVCCGRVRLLAHFAWLHARLPECKHVCHSM